MYVCGDSKKGTVEQCDDGNADDGDGCSSTCEIEAGYVCTAVTNALSVCRVPITPTIEFVRKEFGAFPEGGWA